MQRNLLHRLSTFRISPLAPIILKVAPLDPARRVRATARFRCTGRPRLERVAALSTEFEGWRILEPTMGAAAGKGRGAIAAKFHAVGILKSTF
jgi:hypothetical protein